MEPKVIESKQFTLGPRDFWRGLLMAIGGAVLMFLQNWATSGEPLFNWKAMGMTAVAAGATYLIKNFFEKPKVITVAPTNDQAEVLTQEIKDKVEGV